MVPRVSTDIDLRGRDFLAEKDFSAMEWDHLLTLAARLKAERAAGQERSRLVGKGIALIFEKASTRTRISFEAAIAQQGGFAMVLDPGATQIGYKESIADTAQVLSRVVDGIEYRGSGFSVVEELAAHSDVPVFNGLTDRWHPTQMLADFLTMREHAGSNAPSYVYLGDARNNMGNSLLVTGAIVGADVRIVAPESLWPEASIQELARERASVSGARITLTEDVAEGVPGADFVHTDVWVSMGEPTEVWTQRVDALRPYRVDADIMAMAGNNAKFMHCLPALHDTKTQIARQIADEFGLVDGVEVSSEVFDSTASIVFDQAENRLHTIKAALVATMADEVN